MNSTATGSYDPNARGEDYFILDYIFTNGLSDVMRINWDSENYFLFYFLDLIHADFNRLSSINMGLGIAFTSLFLLILGRLPLSIETLNNRVIAVFVYIPENEILDMRKKCIDFKIENLGDLTDMNKLEQESGRVL